MNFIFHLKKKLYQIIFNEEENFQLFKMKHY